MKVKKINRYIWGESDQSLPSIYTLRKKALRSILVNAVTMKLQQIRSMLKEVNSKDPTEGAQLWRLAPVFDVG